MQENTAEQQSTDAAEPVNDASRRASWRTSRLALTCWVCCLLLTACSCVGFLGRFWWVLDLTNHFRIQYLVVSVAAGVFVGVLRQWGPVLVALFCVFVNLSLVYPLAVRSEPAPFWAEPLRVLNLNVNARNRSHAKVLEAIRRGDPDIIFLLEYNEFWQGALRPLEAEYPHTCTIPQSDNFGMAVYSRLPLVAATPFVLQRPKFAAIELQVDHAGDRWTLLGVHVIPPVSGNASQLRNLQFEELAARVNNKSSPLAVVGDLNCTSWSPHFRRLLAASGLRDSQLGRGVQATWPVQHPVLGIPIDHCLVSPGVEVGPRWLTSNVGSDHRGVFVELSFGARTDEPQGP